ncbi:MAG: hypothetical protein R3C05_30370 [Pirellulaceae bacterium]
MEYKVDRSGTPPARPEQVLSQADQLSWHALVKPFADYSPLRDWHSQIETSVSRLANLVAKCDG